MQGTYRGTELRAHMRREWAELVIPDMMQHETEHLRHLLKRDGEIVAIDVGANKGWWAAALLRTFPGRVKHIFMIDASPENFRELTNFHDHLTLTIEDLRFVSAYPYGMTSEPGSITLYTNDDGSPLASVYQDVTRGWAHEVPRLSKAINVPADTLDHFMERQQLPRIDILKVDVEGHEMSVFRGAERALSQKLIDIVAFEFGIHQIQSRNFFVDFWDYFSRFGYSMWVAREQGLKKIDAYTFEYEDLSRQYGMFATAS